MQPPPFVYIVEDDRAVRESLALWLGMRGRQCRTFDSCEAFLGEARPELRGCAIVDIRMEGMSGLELQRELGRRGVTLPLIFVTGHGDAATARDALKGGAFDFVEKPVDNDKLAGLVTAALEEDERRAQTAAKAQQLKERMARLTQREREVMERVVAGKHNREIAAELGISARTVEVYKARLMDKLDVRRVPDLVRLVMGDEPTSTP
jgi:RNA polymerase sigma factor (sigma-70 family)